MKVCSKCKVEKDEKAFQPCKTSVDGLRGQCKTCRQTVQAEWIKKNRDAINSRSKELYAKSTERYKKYKQKWRVKNKDKQIAAKREWAKLNKHVVNFNTAQRRAKKKNATPSWADKSYIKDLYENCREAEGVFLKVGLKVKFHVDHVVPLRSRKVCGLHCEQNMQILNIQENSSKGNWYWPDMP